MKIAVGGLRAWTEPSTFKVYFALFLPGGLISRWAPLVPSMTRHILSHDFLLRAVAVITLLFECVVIPGSLFISPAFLPGIFCAVVVFHISIGLVQSIVVGSAFITNAPLVWLGLCTGALPPHGSVGWFVMVAVAAFPLLHGLARGFPNNIWPFDNLALYAYSGAQFERMFSMFVAGGKRCCCYGFW